MSYFFGLVGQKNRLIFLLAVALTLLGLCEALDMSYMFAFLAMGIATANTCYYTNNILAEMDRLTGPLCVVFFAVSGVELDMNALVSAGMIGVGYVVLRCTGKYFGVFLAARGTRERTVVKRWLGTTLVSQAGAAIALAAVAARRDPGIGPFICKSLFSARCPSSRSSDRS